MSPLRPVEDLVYVIGEPRPDLDEVGSIGHQPAGLRVIAPGIHPRQTAFLGQLDDQLPVQKKFTCAAHDDRVRGVLSDFSECSLIFGGYWLLDEYIGQPDLQ